MINSKILLLSVCLLVPALPALAGNPKTFLYKGRLSELNSQSITGPVTFKFQIYNPAKDCLLYEEQQIVDMTAKEGLFSVAIGSSVGGALRTGNDPGLEMAKVFSNPGSPLRTSGADCSSGYIPNSGDNRYLRVSVTHNSTTDILSPDQLISSVPFAMTAETLQGKQPGHFLQVNTSGSSSLNQVNLEQIFENSSFARLLDLLNSNTPKDMSGQRITSVAMPSSPTDATNKQYADTRIAGLNVSSSLSSMPAGSFLSYNGIEWSATPLLPHTSSMPAACTTGQASRWDGASWSCINAGGSGGGGGGGAGTISGNNIQQTLTAGSEKVQMVNITTAGSIRLPAADTFTNTGGPMFQLLNAQTIDIPVINAEDKLVGHVPANGATDIFLFNNSSPGGHWLSSASSYHSFFNERVSTNTLPSPLRASSYSTIQGISDNLGLYVYTFDNAGSMEVRAALVSVDPSTKTFTVGSQITLMTTASLPSYGVHILSSNKVVIEISNGGQRTLQLVGISGTTLTAMGSGLSISSYCSYGTIFKTNEAVFCHDSGTSKIHKFNASSSMVYAGISDMTATPNWVLKLNGQEIVAYCDSGQMLNITPLNIGTPVGTNVISGGGNCVSSSSHGLIKNYLEIDATSAWLILSGNPQRKIKISWSGSLTVNDPPTDIGENIGYSAGVLTTGSQTYLTAGSGSSRRAKINNASTFTIGSSERDNDCQGIRSDISHCANFMVEGNTMKGQFQIGY